MKTLKFKNIQHSKNITQAVLLVLVAIGLFSSCKKEVLVDAPDNSLTASQAFSNNASAASVLAGIYSGMGLGGGFSSGKTSVGFMTGLSGDELTLVNKSNANNSNIYADSYNASTGGTGGFTPWANIYNYIYDANSTIEGLTGPNGVTPTVKQQLLGEAYFLRGFYYFYLVNMFGDVPLITKSNYQINQFAARATKLQVYQQIITDLTNAQKMLSPNYLAPDAVTATSERTIPNQVAAQALLARVYLYYANISNDAPSYNNAYAMSSKVITNSNYALVTDLNGVFLANSSEAIWQIQPTQPGYDVYDGYTYILTGRPNFVTTTDLSTNLLSAFETGDLRFTAWVGSVTAAGVTYYYPYKYKIKTTSGAVGLNEYYTVLRLAEQYLIRAESEANGAPGGIPAAINDLNVIRNRAGLPNSTLTGVSTLKDVMSAILHERQVELFTEWGHRWFDLKRTGNIDAVMNIVAPQKGGSWQSYLQLYPLPINDLGTDKNLTQNPGY